MSTKSVVSEEKIFLISEFNRGRCKQNLARTIETVDTEPQTVLEIPMYIQYLSGVVQNCPHRQARNV
jgi:hypothetical protein